MLSRIRHLLGFGCALAVGCGAVGYGALGCGEPRLIPHPEEVPIASYVPPTPRSGPALEVEGDPTEATARTEPTDSAKIDQAEASLGVTFGSGAKSAGRAKLVEKGDRTVLQSLERKRLFGTFVPGALYGFVKGKLATISIRLKTKKECQAMRTEFEKEFGSATRSTPELGVWMGNALGLRFSSDAKGCSGLFVSRKFARPTDWANLQP